MKRLLPLLVLLVSIAAAIALVVIPIHQIRPFTPQTPEGVALAYAVRRVAPWATVLALLLGLIAIARLWSGRRWYTRTALVLAALPLVGAAWAARQNVYEKMFAPLQDPRFASAEEADWVAPEDMVLGVGSGDDAVAYPVRQLAYHHVVMDEVGGVPIVATY